jgi:hypothetical protein
VNHPWTINIHFKNEGQENKTGLFLGFSSIRKEEGIRIRE